MSNFDSLLSMFVEKIYKMKLCYILSCIVFVTLASFSSACHGGPHKRRSMDYESSATIENFFPTCMQNKSSIFGLLKGRNWKSAVAFTLIHSKWYSEVVGDCSGQNDTLKCWMASIGDFIDSSSPALPIARLCILGYYEMRNGRKPSHFDLATQPSHPDPATCPNVDRFAYIKELEENLEESEFAHEDESRNDLNAMLEFVQEEVICRNCPCEGLSDDDDLVMYDFDDGKTCGDCWLTRLPTAVRAGSEYRLPGIRLAKLNGGASGKIRAHLLKPYLRHFQGM